jgi:hypothetical protein
MRTAHLASNDSGLFDVAGEIHITDDEERIGEFEEKVSISSQAVTRRRYNSSV